jgi:hypothetical protein
MTAQILTQERLHSLLDYDPATGVFCWRMTRRNSKQNKIAGTVCPKGYRRISVDARIYLAHRLAWLYQTGVWPSSELDHISRLRDDNRFVNLREATRTTNNQNIGFCTDKLSGYRGVGWHKASNRWRARIQSQGTLFELGYFDSIEAASAAYVAAAKQYHPTRTV